MTKKEQSGKATLANTVMPKALALDVLTKAIDALCKRAASVQADVQEIGVQTLMHLAAHGDVGPANRLYVGLPKGVRKQALGSWLLAHGALDVNTDAGTKKTAPLRYTKAKKTNPEAALADPWYEHMPEKAIDETFDLQRAVHGLLARAKGKTIMLHGKPMSNDHAVDTLKALAAMAGEAYEPEVKQPDAGEPVTEEAPATEGSAS